MQDTEGDVQMQDGKTIDEALYSRQLYVLGHEAMMKMQNSSVLIVGLAGLGTEIAKNVILAGVKSVALLDKSLVKINDLAAGFYFTEDDVGKRKDGVVAEKLAELNPYVPVRVVSEDLSEQVLGGFKVVVLTEQTVDTQIWVDEFCRSHGIGFIAADARGVVGSVFVDLGKDFVISDIDGEQPIKGMIASVTNDKDGIVTVADEHRHGLSSDMYVSFDEIEGMTELNGQERKVKYLGPYTFSIGDTSAFSRYAHSGYFLQVKKPSTVSFMSLKESIRNPVIIPTDFGKLERGIQLHLLTLALTSFRNQNNGRYPHPSSFDDAEKVVNFAIEAAKTIDGSPQVDSNLIRSLARCSGAQIVAMTSIVGGFAAQEVLKACTGKFSPLNQYLYLDAAEVIPKIENLAEFQPQNSRYDDQIAIIGLSLNEKIRAIQAFLVGSGAIGCEILKNWALMGVSTKSPGKIVVTDMDTIEKSNLNRQFLFRSYDVGKLKSEAAASAVSKMNSQIHVIAHANRVGPDSEDLYNDAFWDSIDVVCTALDNVPARLYCDQRCVYFGKPMLESGTLGAKGNTQVIVPKLTQSYGATRDPQEEGIPICTLKNFPNKIEHTIQWARDAFEGIFKQAPEDVNSYLTQPNYLASLAKQPSTQLETLKSIQKLLVEEKSRNFEDCVAWARNLFEFEYVHNIQQLLHNFPPDSLTSTGTKFWSGPKRSPCPIAFDPEDPLHLSYITSAANLRAYVFGLTGSSSTEEVKGILQNVRVKEFQINRNMKIASNEEELKEQKAENSGDFNHLVDQIIQSLPTPGSLAGYQLKPVDFEKDDDTNFHMDFIVATSNLRARNYRIKEESKHETKRIAGKIIPAIATTTALVSGLITLELYKLIRNLPLESYRSAFVNLALPFASFAEPLPPEYKTTMLKGKPWKWSQWDCILIDVGDITLKEFMDYFVEKYELEISMLSYGVSMLYSFFGTSGKAAQRLKMKVSEVVKEVTKNPLKPGSKYLLLEACVNTLDGEDVEIPQIRYKYC